MTDTQLLVRHPAPFPAESVRGYVLRLSQENGYKSPWHLFRLAAMNQGESLRHGMNFEKLAAITNRASAEVCASSDIGTNEQNEKSDFEDAFLLPGAGSAQAQFCPQCVVERGFIEAHWSLSLMTGCPIHKCLAVSFCPVCGHRITWYRCGLLECRCGADLRNSPQLPMTDCDISILDVIRRKVLELPPSEINPSDLPVHHLSAMALPMLLRLITTVAKHRMVTDGCYPPKDERQVVNSAGRVLRDWPENFVELLHDYRLTFKGSDKAKTIVECKKIYRALFSNYAESPEKETDFLLGVLVECAAGEWGYTDSFQMERFRDRLPNGFLSSRHLAEKLSRPTEPGGRDQKDVAPIAHESGFAPADSLQPRETNALITQEGVLTEATAANRLGIGGDILQALVDGGTYKTRYRRVRGGSFHQFDIAAFKRDLLALSPRKALSNTDIGDCISLDTVLSWRWDSPANKAALIEALLKKQVSVVDRFNQTIGGLLIDRKQYHAFIGQVRSRAQSDTEGARESAMFLRCDRTLIPSLLQMGVLQGSDGPGGFRVEKDSLKEFKQHYMFLSAVAKNLHTNTEGLVRVCNRIGISTKWPRRGAKRSLQPFIRVHDLKTLERAALKCERQRPAIKSARVLRTAQVSAPAATTLTRCPAENNNRGWAK